MSEALLPDMSIDFTPYRLKAGDTIEFITKMNTTQSLIETWGNNLGVYGQLIDALLVQARSVPDETRAALLDLLVRAEASRAAMESALAGANLPMMTPGSEGKALIVKPDLSGFTYSDLAQDGSVGAANVAETLDKKFVSTVELGYLYALLQLNPDVYPVWNGAHLGNGRITVVTSLVGISAISLTGKDGSANGRVITKAKYFPEPWQVGQSFDISWGGDPGVITLVSDDIVELTGDSFGDNTLYTITVLKQSEEAPVVDSYSHPDTHSADMIEETSARYFLTPSLVTQWNSKAEGSHGHQASEIVQNAANRFVSDEDKARWNSASSNPATGYKSIWSGEVLLGGDVHPLDLSESVYEFRYIKMFSTYSNNSDAAAYATDVLVSTLSDADYKGVAVGIDDVIGIKVIGTAGNRLSVKNFQSAHDNNIIEIVGVY